MSLRIILPLVVPALLGAQGLPTEWEVRDLAGTIGKQLELLSPGIVEFRTSEWNGAPAAYGEQRDVALKEVSYAVAAARQLAEKPLSLAKAFELHLRVQTIESLVANLATGARAYQSSAPIEQTLDILDTVSQPRGRLRDYVIDLAATKELELSAIDAEAQRCRAELLRSPAPPPAAKKKSK